MTALEASVYSSYVAGTDSPGTSDENNRYGEFTICHGFVALEYWMSFRSRSSFSLCNDVATKVR